jgi:hypothetical protein
VKNVVERLFRKISFGIQGIEGDGRKKFAGGELSNSKIFKRISRLLITVATVQ